MATMIVTHRIANFETWKTAFDGHDGARKAAGFVGTSIHRDDGDANLVTIVLKTPDLAKAKSFAGSPELRAVMEQAGVQGAPDIRFLQDV